MVIVQPAPKSSLTIVSLYDTIVNVNKKHQKTLDDIFATPVRANIVWKDIESMLLALGAEISEGSGSRVRIKLNGAGVSRDG